MIGEHLCVRVCVYKKPSHAIFTSGNSAEAAVLLFYEGIYAYRDIYIYVFERKSNSCLPSDSHCFFHKPIFKLPLFV